MISLSLLPTPAEQQRLLDLQHTFNAACAFIVTEAQGQATAGVFALQALTIGTLLDRFRLPIPLALRAVIVVAQALARQGEDSLSFPKEAAIPLDEQLVRFEGLTQISLVTLNGRISVPFWVHHARRVRGHARPGQATLHLQEGRWVITLILETSLASRMVASLSGNVV
jgi:putative transposase